MKKTFSITFAITLLLTQSSFICSENKQQSYEWAIIGAGFAGISVLAVLIKAGVEPSTIAWIDPEFNVGRVGKYYRNVPSNIQIQHLIMYVYECPYFKEINPCPLQSLITYDSEKFEALHVIADPLLIFTRCLCDKVVPIKDTITSLERVDDHWALKSSDNVIQAKKVILAIGAEPKRLNYDLPEIPLDDAIDAQRLTERINHDDCIAVFGGMHSAILILKHLSECSVKKVINFYKHPYFYDAPGLEGETAAWAHNVLDQRPPANLVRVLNTEENIKRLLPECNKVIYAIGYEPSRIIVNGSSDLIFDECTGIIDRDLYGIGIAFPPTGLVNGYKIAKNGLRAYLGYAKRLVPKWITNEKCCTQLITSKDNEELPWI